MRSLCALLWLPGFALHAGIFSFSAVTDPNLSPDGINGSGTASEVWTCDLPGGATETGSFYFGDDQSWAIYSTPAATAPASAQHAVTQAGIQKVSLEFAHESVATGRFVELRIKSGNNVLFRFGLEGGASDYFFEDENQTVATGIPPMPQTRHYFSLLLNSDTNYVCSIGDFEFEGTHLNNPITEIEILNDCRSSAGAVFFRNLILQSEESGLTVENTIINWSSHEAGGEQLRKQPFLKLGASRTNGLAELTVDLTTELQEFDGAGASLTDASALLINQSAHREEIIRGLFDRQEGIGLSLIRLPLGASDFSESVYSYEDVQGQFSVAPDLTHRIPILKDALALNPSIRLLATPWSAPAWMKDNQSMSGGSLLPAMIDDYAIYLADILSAYKEQGLPIWAISVQNEPAFETPDYPSMSMTAQQQVEVLSALFQEISARGLDTEVMAWDHNYDLGESFLNTVYGDAGVFGPLLGSAWHQYGGNATSMGNIAASYPSKKVFLTERTGQKGNYESNFGYFLGQIFANALNNSSSSILTWNLALDENGGPRLPSVQVNDLSGLVEFDSTDGSFAYWAEHVALGHYAKVAYPGAHRLEVTSGHPVQTFRNPDGTIGVVAWNLTDDIYSYSLKIGDRYVEDHLQAGQAKSYLVFEEEQASGFQEMNSYLEFKNSTYNLVFEDPVFSEFRSFELETSTDMINWMDTDLPDEMLDGYTGRFTLPSFDGPTEFFRARRDYPALPAEN